MLPIFPSTGSFLVINPMTKVAVPVQYRGDGTGQAHRGITSSSQFSAHHSQPFKRRGSRPSGFWFGMTSTSTRRGERWWWHCLRTGVFCLRFALSAPAPLSLLLLLLLPRSSRDRRAMRSRSTVFVRRPLVDVKDRLIGSRQSPRYCNDEHDQNRHQHHQAQPHHRLRGFHGPIPHNKCQRVKSDDAPVVQSARSATGAKIIEAQSESRT